jgi:phosphate transport system permease protein
MTSAFVPASGLDVVALERRRTIQRSAKSSLSRRQNTTKLVRILCIVALIITLIPLVALLSYTVYRGVGALSVDFFTHLPTPEGIPGGGVSNAIVGTIIIDGLALLIGIPIGLVVALFLIERQGPIANAVRFAADVFSGLPSIVIGLFAAIIIVDHTHTFSGWAASVALAVLMLPIMIRADEEAMRTVPVDLWEAGTALGARQSRVVRSVVVRSALPGLVTGNILALARAVGETAPLLFVTLLTTTMNLNPLQAMGSLPLVIFENSSTPYKDLQQTAWGAAFILLAGVFLLSVVARLIAARMGRQAR